MKNKEGSDNEVSVFAAMGVEHEAEFAAGLKPSHGGQDLIFDSYDGFIKYNIGKQIKQRTKIKRRSSKSSILQTARHFPSWKRVLLNT